MNDLHNRRTFLRAAAAAGVAWAATDLLQVDQALAWAGTQAASPQRATTSVLTAPQAEVVDALTSRIIPSVDGRPGAREAGVLFFIDRALATFNASQRQGYVDGVAQLNRRAAAMSPGASFSALAPAQQDDIIREIEQTPFFQSIRFDTIVGMFALPSWGGNRDYAGWHLLGFEHQPRFQAPFGYYDAEIKGRG